MFTKTHFPFLHLLLQAGASFDEVCLMGVEKHVPLLGLFHKTSLGASPYFSACLGGPPPG